MNKLIVAAIVSAVSFSFSLAQGDDGAYVFTPVKELKVTSVKNQNRTGTCWVFSALSHLESELIRTGKGEYDFSEMFVVNLSYKDKADKYVRTTGMLNFAQGGSFDDVRYVMEHYGIVPEDVQPGLDYGENMHVHGEMEKAAAEYLKAIVSNPNGKLSTAWKRGFDGIIDAYLGKTPETFTYAGKTYTPLSFARELGLDMGDYVSLTSFTHHPFYSTFALEIPDNWRWTESYNVPVDELIEIIRNAINTGYTVAWASDVSETGFTRDGVGVAPDVETIMASGPTSGSDQERWVGLSAREKNEEILKLLDKPIQELTVTQEMRQAGFDNFQTTDDHGMHIYGIAKDQTGKDFFIVKNSWGTASKYNGIWYVSEAFARHKTIDIVVHKDAIPHAIRAKLKL
ncbi:MAG: C1 family peptidase [Tannerellaceae bacterium]|jgi:aminopeptidase C|nr:C1 family peptidase [Tannerellaceae bacterium]